MIRVLSLFKNFIIIFCFLVTTFNISVTHAYAIRIADTGAYHLAQLLVNNIEIVGNNYFLNYYKLGNLQYIAKTYDGLYDLYVLSYGTGIHNGMIGYYATPDGYIEKIAVSWNSKDKIGEDASLRITTPLLATLGMSVQEMDVLYRALSLRHNPISVWCNNTGRQIILNVEMDNDGVVRFIYTAER